MKVVVAPNPFKGSLTSIQACAAINRGISKADPSIKVVSIPMADGGDGTVDALLNALGGKKVEAWVKDPLFRKIKAKYAILEDGKTAVIEMAKASGLVLLSDDEKNPMNTTTYGTGELIKYALDRGCRNFIIGIGGSATNDGGIGMAAALGVKFNDEKGRSIDFSGKGLLSLNSIDLSQLDYRVKESQFRVFCDVDNPLYGPKGAAHVYGRQKGADDTMIQKLDNGLRRLADVIRKDLGLNVDFLPGAGAAGGLGAGLVAFLNAKLEKGIDLIMEVIGFEDKIKDASLIITGEGSMDHQTAHGKAVFGILKSAKKQGIPVVALCGSIGEGIEQLYSQGLTSVFSIVNRPMELSQSMEESSQLLSSAAENVIRLFKAQNKCHP